MAKTTSYRAERPEEREQRRFYRVERRFCGQRRAEELVRDLLQAHCEP